MDKIMTSESGSESTITSLGPGYFLWLSSFLIFTIGIGIKLKQAMIPRYSKNNEKGEG